MIPSLVNDEPNLQFPLAKVFRCFTNRAQVKVEVGWRSSCVQRLCVNLGLVFGKFELWPHS